MNTAASSPAARGQVAHRIVERGRRVGAQLGQHPRGGLGHAPGAAEQHAPAHRRTTALQLDRLRQPDLASPTVARDRQPHQLRVAIAHARYFSRIATTPWPPAAQIEITPRPPPRSFSAFASEATIRPPVAANGCPAASEPPLTLSLSAVDLAQRRVAPEPLAREHRVPPRLQRRQHLRGERLVDLVEVEVVEAPARCARASAASRRRAPSAGPRPCARGRRPRSARRRSTPAPAARAPPPTPRDASSTAEAPSVSGVELPAVIVPSAPPNTGLSFASFSTDESGAQVLVALEPEVRADQLVEEPALVRGGHVLRARPRPARPARRA